MAIANNTYWYIGSTKYAAVTAWAASTVYSAGAIRRQLATPAAGSERCFACIIAGTSLGTEPTWTITKGAKTAEAAGPTWIEVTGQQLVNGDTTNAPVWVVSTTAALGQTIYDSVTSSVQVCTTAGTTKSGAAPSFSATAGTTTTDNTVTWTSLGLASGITAWGAPHARLRNAYTSTWGAAGHTFYVSNNHAATEAAALSFTAMPGTAANPVTTMCVADTAVPPVATATTATEATTGASTITLGGGYGYLYGLTFLAGSSSNVANINIGNSGTACGLYFENCGLTLNNSGASLIQLGGATLAPADTYIELRNCAYVFGGTSQGIKYGNMLGGIVGGTFAATGSTPGTAFTIGITSGTLFNVRDLDLSAIVGSLQSGGGSAVPSGLLLQNCKLGAAVTPMNTITVGPGGAYIRMHNCDSGATNYRYYFGNYLAALQSNTGIYRTGGATDGTTPICWQIASTANAKTQQPFVSEEIAQWQDTTGSSKTATIELTTDATLTNADCWMEIEYLGSSGSPLGSIVTTKVALLATAATLTTSAASWTGGKANNYKIAATFTPQMKGPIKARLFVAKASATVYFDPLLTVV